MKKVLMKTIGIYNVILIIGFSYLLMGCSVDDGKSNVNFSYKLNEIISVEIPDTVRENGIYDLEIEFKKSADCYSFSGFDFKIGENENERIISVISSVVDVDNTCQKYKSPKTEIENFEFSVRRDDYYILKFWQGIDSLNKPIYLTKRIEVR